MKNLISTVGYVLFFVLIATAYVLRPMHALAAVSAHHRVVLHADEKHSDASAPATSGSTESDAEDSGTEDDAGDDAEEGE